MKLKISGLLTSIMLSTVYSVSFASINVPELINNMEKNDKQSVLVGQIDSLTLKRGLAEWHLGPGELTLFDFGTGRTVAMVFTGKGRFIYTPPDEMERGQLSKFTGQEKLDDKIISATFVFGAQLENMPDTAKFSRSVVIRETWAAIYDTWLNAFNYLGVYLSTALIEDMLSKYPGSCFYADFKLERIEHLAFYENPYNNDRYRLYELNRVKGEQTYDVLGGYSLDDGLVWHRGIIPIDITHYQIDAKIAENGEMMTHCRIYYAGVISGKKYIRLSWYRKNEIKTALDSRGDTLKIVNRNIGFRLLDKFTKDDEFGLVLNKPIIDGDSDYIDIFYKGKTLTNTAGYLRLEEFSKWYPKNMARDCSSYEMDFEYPSNYDIVATGRRVVFINTGKTKVTKFIEDYPITDATFYLGMMTPLTVALENMPVVQAFIQESKLSYDKVFADATNSLSLFTYLFGSCSFDTVRIIEDAWNGTASSPGIIYLPRTMFIIEDNGGWQEASRASLIARQWCGNIIYVENYRDEWIVSGLSEYCGYWFYELSSNNPLASKDMLFNIRRYIFTGSGPGSQGSKAGSMTLGRRLDCSKSMDYNPNVNFKAAYCFHMLRYLMHDYTTDSDDSFKALLKDMADQFKDKPITTADVQVLVEKHLYPNMKWFFDEWINGTSIPDYAFSYKTAKTADGKYKVTCHVKQENVPDNFQMMIPITVEFGVNKKLNMQIMVKQSEQDIVLPTLSLEPTKIIFNAYDAVLCNVSYE